MVANPEWYLITIEQAEKTDRLNINGIPVARQAGDKAGAEWLARTTLEDLARSKDIKLSQLTSTVTPCKDC